jgi:hypothetical protein
MQSEYRDKILSGKGILNNTIHFSEYKLTVKYKYDEIMVEV